MDVPRRLIVAALIVAALVVGRAADGPLTNAANILARTDGSGYLLAAAQTYTGPDGPRRPLANTLVRTDASGYLIITNPTGFGAPLDAQYWLGAANSTLTAEKNLGALSTALVVNTSGTPSAYAGTSCTNQFLTALSAVGAGTCATAASEATQQDSSATGTQNNFSLTAANTILRIANASDVTFTGFTIGGAAPTAGDQVTIVSVGAGHVLLSHQGGTSTAEHRLINLATSAATRLAAGAGTATYVYDDTSDRWRLSVHDQGAFIHDASATYTASGSMTWTVAAGDISRWAYYLSGRVLQLQFSLVDTTLGGTPSSTLEGTIPGGYTNTTATHSTYQLKNTTTIAAGHVFASSSATTIGFRKIDDSNLTVSGSDNNDVLGQLTLAVN